MISLRKVGIKSKDKLGRIIISKEWQERLVGIVILVMKNFKLTDLFDTIEFSGDIEDWIYVKRIKRRLLDETSGF